jgi:hypothetical protein
MAGFPWRLAWTLAGGVLLSGCCPTLPVVPHAIRCDASAELLRAKCPSPTRIPEDATFGTLVDAMRSDRQALRECGRALDALRDSIDRCNRATDEFNKRIDRINADAKKGAP